ncbi:hypothetical protein GCM10027347_53800 [Larkinella harenae]
MNPVFLEWDSQFFGFKIGQLTQIHAQHLTEVLEVARKQHYKLLYVFTDVEVAIPEQTLQTYNGRFVDHKRTYERELISKSVPLATSVRLFQANDDIHQLYKLAYQSGGFSRFKIDPAFGEARFQELYRQWIDRSVAGGIADAVFVWKTAGFVNGLITVKQKGNTGVIGLLATDAHHRKQGIGTGLLTQVEQYAFNANLTRLEVTTQGANVLACQFYEKKQFVVKSETNVYHFWL